MPNFSIPDATGAAVTVDSDDVTLLNGVQVSSHKMERVKLAYGPENEAQEVDGVNFPFPVGRPAAKLLGSESLQFPDSSSALEVEEILDLGAPEDHFNSIDGFVFLIVRNPSPDTAINIERQYEFLDPADSSLRWASFSGMSGVQTVQILGDYHGTAGNPAAECLFFDGPVLGLGSRFRFTNVSALGVGDGFELSVQAWLA